MPREGEKVMSLRMNAETARLLEELAKKRGLSKTAILTVLVQEAARREGVR
jgi:predicted DNA-binding protein